MRTQRLVACLFLLSGLSGWSAAPAAEFVVTSRLDSGAGTLREAMFAANSTANPPHTIRFESPYPIGGRIVLASTLPSLGQATIIDGGDRFAQLSGNEQFPLLLTSQPLTIRNLQLMDGWAPAVNTTAGNGGCIRYNGMGGNLLVENARFENCAARSLLIASGGAIQWLSGSGSVTIRNSVFQLNAAVSNDAGSEQPRGGAIAASGDILIEDSTFENTQVRALGGTNGGFGGALSLVAPIGGTVTIRGNRFRFNVATPDAADLGWGGAVYVSVDSNSQVTLENNWFRENLARLGGATHIRMLGTGSTLALSNNSFQGNEAVEGGQLSVIGGQIRLWHNSFDAGLATSGSQLRLESSDVRQFSNNLLGRSTGTSACQTIGINRANLVGAGNVLVAPCTGLELADDQLLGSDPLPIRDETQRIGVLVYANELGIVDRGNDLPEHCLLTDARGTQRSLDGNGDGGTRCDPGALEHASPRVFRDGFETISIP